MLLGSCVSRGKLVFSGVLLAFWVGTCNGGFDVKRLTTTAILFIKGVLLCGWSRGRKKGKEARPQ